MAYAARVVARIHPAAPLAATARSEPRHPSSLPVGERLGDTRVYCLVVSCRMVSWLCSIDRDESEINRVAGATYSLRHERRPPAMLRVLGQAGALSGCTTVQQQKFVAKSAISVVKGGDAFFGVKQNTRPIIVIDNYDSFTYNLCQYMGEVGANFEVYRNDEITVEEIKKISPRGILISPGPGTPQDSGISLQTVTELGPSIPLFGVCMGLQCIGEAFGGKVVRSPYGVVHGKGSPVHYDEKLDGTLFSGLPNPFQAGRYHSLVIEKDSFPHDALEIVAWTDDGLIMAARHRKYRHIQGVQFHPESIITTEGRLMVKNFIKIIEGYEALNGIP